MPYAENEGEEISTELFTASNEGNWSCVMVWECEIVVGIDNWVSTFSIVRFYGQQPQERAYAWKMFM
jgi:hypothetical protein